MVQKLIATTTGSVPSYADALKEVQGLLANGWRLAFAPSVSRSGDDHPKMTVIFVLDPPEDSVNVSIPTDSPAATADVWRSPYIGS